MILFQNLGGRVFLSPPAGQTRSNKDCLQLSFVHGQTLCTYPKPQQDTVQVKHAETT